MESLNILNPPALDNSLKQYHFQLFPPNNPNSLDHNDTIHFNIQRLESFTRPHDSYLHIEGRALDFTEPVDTKLDASVELTSNFAAFLFSDIKYELNAVTIDSVKNVGVTTCMKGLASLTKDQSEAMQVASWGTPHVSDDGYFSVMIPLKFLAGFFEDYKHILVNTRQELILTRSKNDDNCFASTTDKKGKIKLSSITWKLPFLQPSDDQRLRLMNIINKNVTIPMAFRSWEMFQYPSIPSNSNQLNWQIKISTNLERPRMVLFALQTDKIDNAKANASHFDHANIKEVKLQLNNETIPYSNYNTEFTKNKFDQVFNDFTRFKKAYYDGFSEESAISMSDFKTKFPIFVIDCSNFQDVLNLATTVDIRLFVETTSGNFPANTNAYCLILSDRMLNYSPLEGIVKKLV